VYKTLEDGGGTCHLNFAVSQPNHTASHFRGLSSDCFMRGWQILLSWAVVMFVCPKSEHCRIVIYVLRLCNFYFMWTGIA